MKYKFIKEYSEKFPVSRICHILKISKSGYYAWVKNPKSQRDKDNDLLVEKIKDYHQQSREKYGSPRIYQDLKENNIQCGLNRVARLMKINNIQAKLKKRFKITTDSNHKEPIADNVLDRNFSAKEKNKKWVSDITYINTAEGWLYLCIVMDLYSRSIVGWSMDNNMRTKLVMDAFMMAYKKRKPLGKIIFHSDRGVQYASNEFTEMLKSKNCIASMSRKGNCWDNACAESFFHTLKTEEVNFQYYKTREEAKRNIFEYIEVFYNRKRRHSTLDYMSPKNFELKKVV
jgi:transposase InsO family protein